MNNASFLFIPAGRIQHFQRIQSASAKSLANVRDRKRRLNPADETLNDLNKQIQKPVVEDKRTKWQSSVDKCDNQIGKSHPWRLAKGPSGKKTNNSTYNGVRFAEKAYLDHMKTANKFTPPPIRLAGDKLKRHLKRQFHQLPLTGTTSFTPAATKAAIQLAKIVHCHRTRRYEHPLPHGAINYLTNIFNLSISTGQIPEIWYKAMIIPILIPG